ncbi:Sirohydrochlorin ferrochelatase [Corynebacterium atrinae]|uniref:sirohydrochlorin chelatase n=1 Tax=Corynebacterium atrinae TaxID=1336740 RepID=UPI0025B5931B|nr:sirohydrochlorin chelatase [Corynebacterium atrinae]WJY64477.1 Sirohydrochlorin ferrochelatase [Corynebacterium atrinae]
MTALITLSHGSRHPSASGGIRRLTRAAGQLIDAPAFDAHLDFTEPTLPDVALQLAAAGHREAVVVPLLFTDAFHARHDVPAVVSVAAEVSGLALHVAPGLGTGEEVAGVLSQRVALDAPTGAHVVLYPVGTTDPAAHGRLVELGARVAELSGHSVCVVPATGPAGSGGAGVIEAAMGRRAVHVLPLFVTDGLLLDRLREQLPRIAAATGARFTSSPPLSIDLAAVVAARYQAALPLPAV